MGGQPEQLAADWTGDDGDLDEKYDSRSFSGSGMGNSSVGPKSGVSVVRDADEGKWRGGVEADGYKPDPDDGELRVDPVPFGSA